LGAACDYDPRELPSALWGNDNWDYMDPGAREQFLGRLLVTQLGRISSTPVYAAIGSRLANVKPEEFEDMDAMEILKRLPILRKDSARGDGFRLRATQDEGVMKPTIPSVADTEWTKWYSGGTKGDPTPTFLTGKDLEAEAYALARGFRQGGFGRGDTIFTTYNLTHKGGRLIVDASKLLGMNVLTKDDMVQSGMEFNIDNLLRFMRDRDVDAIATVQPYDLGKGDATKKGAGVTFLGLYEKDPQLFGKAGKIKTAFVTGYWLLPSIIKACEDAGVELFTIDGASEVLPIAGSTPMAVAAGWPCSYNNLHLHQGPHYTMLVDKTRARNDEIVPAENPGQRGIVLHTTIGRGYGTMFVDYQIGDFGTFGPVGYRDTCACGRTTPIISDIQRQDRPLTEVLGAGCVADV
jgi:phenylacetate-coenzyme A ligase PaaK-like adenylate-forming protein